MAPPLPLKLDRSIPRPIHLSPRPDQVFKSLVADPPLVGNSCRKRRDSSHQNGESGNVKKADKKTMNEMFASTCEEKWQRLLEAEFKFYAARMDLES